MYASTNQTTGNTQKTLLLFIADGIKKNYNSNMFRLKIKKKNSGKQVKYELRKVSIIFLLYRYFRCNMNYAKFYYHQ